MRDLPWLFTKAGALLLRHWPALLVLGLLGAALRAGAVWGAIRVSHAHHHLAQLLLTLAPVGVLLPMIAMFEVCRRSLPRLDELARVPAEPMPTEQRPERLVDVAASILIPFLAVYESYGLLDQDISRFRNSAAFDEIIGRLGEGDLDAAGRIGIYSVPVAAAIIAGAWVVRWLIGLVERVSGLLFLAYVGALADVFYTVQLAGQIVVLRVTGGRWLADRKALHWAASAYHWVADGLGFLGGPFRTVAEFVGALSGSWNEIILVPIAWLGVGAVVLARKEADEEEEAADAREPDDDRAPDRTWPAPVRVLLSLAADLRKRLSALGSALRLLAAGGLVPMLIFSLVLLVVARIPAMTAPLVHTLVGPHRAISYFVYSPFVESFELAFSLMLTVPLVAAAVAWLTTTRLRREGLLADLDARTGAQPAGTGSAT